MGQTYGGRYEAQARLGSGGMAKVYRAQDTRLLRPVALKVLNHAAVGEQGVLLFHREARAIAALSHVNIVQVYDYSGPEEAPAYLVMELIDGETLDRVIDAGKPLPERVVVSIAHGIALALAHAHASGVMHRDIKPANVMVDDSGRVLLTDFGIAKAWADPKLLGDTLVGQQTQLLGTPSFMAPEQLLEAEIGPLTDVFSFGSLVYCTAVGHSPFGSGKDPVNTMRRIIDGRFKALQEARPDLSAPVVDLVMSCLRKEPRERPTAEAVTQQCESWLLAHDVVNAQRHIAAYLRRGQVTDETQPDWHDATAEAPIESGHTQIVPADGPHATMSDTVPGWRAVAEAESVAAIDDASSAASEAETDVRGAPPVDTGSSPGWQVQPAAAVTQTAHVDKRKPQVMSETVVTAPNDAPILRAEVPSAPNWVTWAAAAAAVVCLLAVTFLVAYWRGHTGDRPMAPVVVAPVVVAPVAEVTPDPGSTLADPAATTADSVAPAPAAASPPAALVAGSDTSDVLPTAESPTVTSAETPAAPPPVATPGASTSTEARRATRRKTSRTPRKAARLGDATLILVVRPWGTVFVDGEKQGNTPVVRSVTLPSGRHTIRVEHPSLGTAERTVVLRAGQEKSLSFDLRP